MAEFSKQWREKNDPEIPYDFDILEEAKNLKPREGFMRICEGFGFTYISKNENNVLMLGFVDYQTDMIEWKTYDELMN
jgi:hypothetical protein